MLTRDQNETLCRITSGAPMGDLVRRFWLPALLSEELAEPDCPPVRVRLMGEDLVAFRDTSGNVGLVANNCPHRGASLFFGRNEEEGLRCVYHGWKYDLSGACVDMPNEPPESNFKHKIHLTAYPTRERSGLIWAYMGPLELQPAEPPAFEWNMVPQDHVVLSRTLQESNWVQAVEGGIDSSHVSFLHSRFETQPVNLGGGPVLTKYMKGDKHPHFETVETGYGILIGARRNAEDHSYYWRITQYLLPFYTMIPGAADPGQPISGHAWVPIDDENCWRYSVTWRSDRPFTDEERDRILHGHGIHAEHIPGSYMALRNIRNDYLVDREMQKTGNFSGILGTGEQDTACQETMGPIYDRTKEHLGSADSAIIHMRRVLLWLVKELQEGHEPEAAIAADAFKVRSCSIILPRNVVWIQGAQQRLRANSPYVTA